MNVIKVTGNNRKAVLDFLNEYMIPSHKPKDNHGLVVNKDNCFIQLEANVFTTHLNYSGPTITVKQARELYKPKETKSEKTQRSRAMMYKLKYEQLRDELLNVNSELACAVVLYDNSVYNETKLKQELSNVNKLNESQSIQIETLSNSLVDIEASNKHLQKQLDTNQNLYMKEREKTVRLTDLWEENEKEVQHLKREKTSMAGQIMQAEMEYEDLLHYHDTANKTIQDYKRTTIALTIGVIALIATIWIG